MRVYGVLTLALALVMIGLGLAIVAIALARGGGTVGVILGFLFVAAGAGRLYVLGKR
ncbi:MAG TPA: hypothetical protein VG652_10560 [Gaiellaceae bacterium]|nr:hypothetical protein [Gaiellaceae bacterium]